jgi:putative transposase
VTVWGVIDHGSRTILQLEPLQRFNSLILLGKLIQAFGEYGKPKAIRTDNASVFKTFVFRAVLKLLRVNQQFTELHSPWLNGRIERFWRTLKETLGTEMKRLRNGARILEEQMRFANLDAMREVLRDFHCFYNFSRPHQALKGQTPAQVWNAQVTRRKECSAKGHPRRRAHTHRREKPPDP